MDYGILKGPALIEKTGIAIAGVQSTPRILLFFIAVVFRLPAPFLKMGLDDLRKVYPIFGGGNK